MISPQDPHVRSLEKTTQPPVPNHPCYSSRKQPPAILKTLICSTETLQNLSEKNFVAGVTF